MCPLSCIHNVHNKLFGGLLSSKVLCSIVSVGGRKLTTIDDTAEGSRSAEEMNSMWDQNVIILQHWRKFNVTCSPTFTVGELT